MAGQSFLVLAAVAAPVVLLAGWVGGRGYRAMRDRADRADEGKAAERAEIAEEFALPVSPDLALLNTSEAKARTADWRQTLHEPAIAAKNHYYEFIGRCGVLLALIFMLMALSLTLLQGQEWPELNGIFAAIDLFAMAYVLLHWWHSKRANQDWVLKRIHSELMRQWLLLVFLFGWGEKAVAAGYEEAKRQIEADVLKPKSRFWQWLGLGLTSEALERRIEAYWERLGKELKDNSAITQPPANWDAVLATYLNRRPVNQLQWYRMRHRQFSRAGRWRGSVMTALFLAAFALAIANVFLVPPSGTGNDKIAGLVNFGLLVTTAISAALTYWYVSRNERSISHRYVTQRREIEGWLGRTATAVGEQEPARVLEQALEFEALMISELIDWVHVTSHDVAELGA